MFFYNILILFYVLIFNFSYFNPKNKIKKMTCGGCQYEFCWLCDGLYTPKHYYSSESPCNGKQYFPPPPSFTTLYDPLSVLINQKNNKKKNSLLPSFLRRSSKNKKNKSNKNNNNNNNNNGNKIRMADGAKRDEVRVTVMGPEQAGKSILVSQFSKEYYDQFVCSFLL